VAVVTVAIPTYNRSALTRRAIESVVAQTFSDWVLVVIDNASSDDTEAMVRSFGDPRIRFERNEVNIGHRRNITKALRAGTATPGLATPYTAVLFSDDVFYPENLARKVAFLEAHPEVGLVHSACRLIDADGATLIDSTVLGSARDGAVETSEQFVRRSFEESIRVWYSAAVLRSDLAAHLEAREQDHPADDHRLWLEAGLRAPVGYLDAPLASMSVTPGWSTENGYQTIGPDGFFGQTLSGLLGERRIREEFLIDHDHDLGLRRAFALRRASNACFRRRVAGCLIRGGRFGRLPVVHRDARRIWARAVLCDALVAVDARTWKAMLGR
jgi:glycosyltransferase involved in cell wall biosynthesis